MMTGYTFPSFSIQLLFVVLIFLSFHSSSSSTSASTSGLSVVRKHHPVDHQYPHSLDTPISSASTPNLYITYAVGYNTSLIQRVVNNCQRYCGNSSDIVIFVKGSLREMTFEYPDRVKLIVLSKNAHSKFLIRFFAINNWLQSHSDHYKKVIFSDARDIVFQREPFEQIKSNGVYIFEETFNFTTEETNPKWLKSCYGANYSKRFVDTGMNILCVGVVMGTQPEMKIYFEEMARELFHAKKINRRCWTSTGGDTAANYKVVFDVLPNRSVPVHVVEEGQGLTTHYPRIPHHFDTSGRLLNSNGIPYALVHHADRMKEFFARHALQYPYVGNDY